VVLRARISSVSRPAQRRRTLQRADDQRRRGWDDGDLGLSVLDGELYGDPETFPSRGGFSYVLSDFLRRLFDVRRVMSNILKNPRGRRVIRTRPSGPILGARAEEAPTSPPVARRYIIFISFGSWKTG